jgi:hypothetical protein
LPRKNTFADKQHKCFGYHFRVNATKNPRPVSRSENFRRVGLNCAALSMVGSGEQIRYLQPAVAGDSPTVIFWDF